MSSPEAKKLEDFITEPQIRKHLENGGYVIVRIGDVQFWVNQELVDALLEQPPRENRVFPEAKNIYISENTATRIYEALDGPRFNLQYNQFLSIKKKYEYIDEEQPHLMAESDLYALHSILEASYKEIFERQINDDPYPTDMCIEICTFMHKFSNADVRIQDIKLTDEGIFCEADGIDWSISIPTKGKKISIEAAKRMNNV